MAARRMHSLQAGEGALLAAPSKQGVLPYFRTLCSRSRAQGLRQEQRWDGPSCQGMKASQKNALLVLDSSPSF